MVGQTQESALDLGPHKTAPGTQRSCAATGAVRPVDEMIRFVMNPDGVAVPDLKRRLPGRGRETAGAATDRGLSHAALERNAFARAFKRDVRVTPDVVDTTERLIERTALEALAICHKAGKVAIGFSNVAAALARARVVAVCNAAEAAPDGRRKLAAALHRRADVAEIRTVDAFTSVQLDLALGRSNVVHAALLAGPASDGFMTRCSSLERFRAVDPDGRAR